MSRKTGNLKFTLLAGSGVLATGHSARTVHFQVVQWTASSHTVMEQRLREPAPFGLPLTRVIPSRRRQVLTCSLTIVPIIRPAIPSFKWMRHSARTALVGNSRIVTDKDADRSAQTAGEFLFADPEMSDADRWHRQAFRLSWAWQVAAAWDY
jgi:hypothetical protein